MEVEWLEIEEKLKSNYTSNKQSRSSFLAFPFLLAASIGWRPSDGWSARLNQHGIIITSSYWRGYSWSFDALSSISAWRVLRVRPTLGAFLLEFFHESFLDASLLSIPPLTLFGQRWLVLFNALAESWVACHLFGWLKDCVAPIWCVRISLPTGQK